MPDVSVMIMAFNEVANLPTVAREIHGALAGLGRPFELVIIDDGSRDGTGAAADELAGELAGVRVIHHEANQGLGGVYRTGFREARGTYLTFFPADGQFPATIIAQFLPLMETHDLVLGYLPQRASSWLAKALSWIERLLYRLIFGPLPTFQGIMMVRRSLLDTVTLRSSGRGWAVLMELIIRLSRAKRPLISVPTGFRPRLSGHSKVNNLRTIWSNFKQMLTLRQYL